MARKSKDKSEVEHLRGELREADKLIKALKRRLRTLEKSKHVWTQYNLDADENSAPDVQEIMEVKCTACNNGTVLAIDLGLKTLHSCSSCLWRKTTIKNG